MARLSVNLNKVALLRNSRRTGVPDVLHFAKLVHSAGAHGVTVHPRPDQRHIRRSDVPALSELMRPWRPAFEFNIEGFPDPAFLDLIASVKPEQCTLVPDDPNVFTSEEGWKLDDKQRALIVPTVETLKRQGARAILFVDPDPGVVEKVAAAGADGIEIYTGAYAAAFKEGKHQALLAQCAQTAERAKALGLVVNAGHDLNLENIPPLVGAIPHLAEASIGHELTADALLMGFEAAVRAYKAALAGTP